MPVRMFGLQALRDGLSPERHPLSVTFCSTLRDRLFIGEDIKRLEMKTRWEAAMNDFEETYSESALERQVELISMSIVTITHKDRVQ